MSASPDPFMRVALALSQANSARQPSTNEVGGLRHFFQAVTRPDERNPAAMVIGLDCSDPSAQGGFKREMNSDTRDLLLIYENHMLLIGNPMRGAGLGTFAKVFLSSFTKQGKAKSTPHSRVLRGDLNTAEIVGRPSWDESERFVHLAGTGLEVWFWINLAVDSDDAVKTALGG